MKPDEDNIKHKKVLTVCAVVAVAGVVAEAVLRRVLRRYV